MKKGRPVPKLTKNEVVAPSHLPPRASGQSQTAIDPWTATSAEERAEVYTRGMFLQHLNLVGRKITDNINSDVDESKRLRAARQEAAAGKTKTYRKRATK